MAAKTNTTITTDEIQHIITTLAEDYEAKHSPHLTAEKHHTLCCQSYQIAPLR